MTVMTRRSLCRGALCSGVSLDLLGLLRARCQGTVLEADRAGSLPPLRSCIWIFLYGGPSHLDTFDMKPGAPAEVRGEFRPIATSAPGIQICEHLPLLARSMHRVAIIRGMHHANRLHDSASIETLTGRLPPQGDRELFSPMPQVFPSFGGLLSRLMRDRDLPVAHAALPFVFHNVVDVPCQGGGFLGPAYDPFQIEVEPEKEAYRAELLSRPETLTNLRYDARRRLLDVVEELAGESAAATVGSGMNEHFAKAFRLLASPEIRRALDLSREDPRLKDRYGTPAGAWAPGPTNGAEHAYGRNMRGQNLLLARRLVEAGVPFVNVYDFKQQGQNWDSHVANFAQHKDHLLPPFDQGLSALHDDLDSRGLLESTLVVAAGEFGRTPRINKEAGRDHWPDCFSVILAGGGVRGGTVHGASDRRGAYPASDPVTPADLAATIFWRFGIDPASEVCDELGRPFKISEGKPITGVFG
jgi:hypothetical protein